MNKTIFISIASYKDPLLSFTITSAISKATHPERLRFGIVEQHFVEERYKPQTTRIKYLGVEPKDSRGVCWARSLAMNLYSGEDYYFQIDSHMYFDDGWDERLIESMQECKQVSKKPIISSFPRSFTMEDGQPKILNNLTCAYGHVIVANAELKPDDTFLPVHAVSSHVDENLKGFHVAAGCLFTLGSFVNEVPYDPNIYFNGEEQSVALRAYTHGWDIFHTYNLPVYHMYDNKEGKFYRPRHWEKTEDEGRQIDWEEINKQSRKRLVDLMYKGEDLGIYGLGKERTREQYAEFCGVDYVNKKLNPTAFNGPWAKTTKQRYGMSFKNFDAAVGHMLKEIKPKRVLDIGCGEGKYGSMVIDNVPDCELTGIEIEQDHVDRYNLKNLYKEVRVGDAWQVLQKNPDEFFDVVILGDCIEHMPKSVGLDLLNFLTYRTQYIILIIPEFIVQGTVHEKHSASHISVWSQYDFIWHDSWAWDNSYTISLVVLRGYQKADKPMKELVESVNSAELPVYQGYSDKITRTTRLRPVSNPRAEMIGGVPQNYRHP
jgi:protein-L-isoaspartate O-methyltransferase